jgi:hypothetical protein
MPSCSRDLYEFLIRNRKFHMACLRPSRASFPQFSRAELNMLDLVYLGLGVVVLIVMGFYARACGRL